MKLRKVQNRLLSRAKYFIALITLILIASSNAQATLILQNDGTEVLDTNTNLIWMQDWSFGGYHSAANALVWANSVVYAGNSTWRIPTLTEGTQLGATYGLSDLFLNVKNTYYSNGTRGSQTWVFYAGNGAQTFASNGFARSVVGVRTATAADVAFSTSVPEPSTIAIFALGLLGLAARRCKQ